MQNTLAWKPKRSFFRKRFGDVPVDLMTNSKNWDRLQLSISIAVLLMPLLQA